LGKTRILADGGRAGLAGVCYGFHAAGLIVGAKRLLFAPDVPAGLSGNDEAVARPTQLLGEHAVISDSVALH